MRQELSVGGRLIAVATPAGQARGEVMTIVIEGDGRAHDARGRPTADPTPARPLGLAIARAWPDGPRAWLARPCQFTRRRDAACDPRDWTWDRFSSPMLEALDAAVDTLKDEAGARRVRLVGWSGGGVMAAALARRRTDVAGLATFAAPLDVAAWTSARGLSPLNLAPEVASLASGALPVRQVHLIGDRDAVVPPGEARTWASRLGGAVEVVGEPHAGDWPRHVPETAAKLKGD